MKITELSREQLRQVKQHYYCMKNENVSYDELAFIDDYVTDSEVFEDYENTNFVEGDFC